MILAHKQKDDIYASPQAQIARFAFDKDVADVFSDMIHRSVPGYDAIVTMIGVVGGQFAQEHSTCYDLGCSLGAATLVLGTSIEKQNCNIIAVDNSPAMVDKCRENIAASRLNIPADVICADIENVEINRARVVILNFTLQFVKPLHRGKLLQKIYHGMQTGGVLIISDKITFDDKREREFQNNQHLAWKKTNGYSELEIAQKRTALENVLMPDTIEKHQRRLRSIGFRSFHVWFRCFNFASMMAVK